MDASQIEAIEKSLEALNANLDGMPFRLAFVDPKLPKPAPKNAHYMEKRTFNTLANNIRQDGNLTSAPLCWRLEDGSFRILSGHHRIAAAVEAKVPRILIYYVTQELVRSQELAIQLSHNSLVGQDNPVILTELWREIDDLNAKIYSGLDDQFIESLETPRFDRIDDAALTYEELSFYFVRPEIDRLQAIVDVMSGKAKKNLALVASFEQFDRFFRDLIAFKEVSGVRNSSTALAMMLDIVEEWIEENREDESVEQSEGVQDGGTEPEA